jgi:AcrR family transcriptional regulator
MLEAALELASEGGYEAVQMREVASSADVALGTLYRYFPSKDHLLLAAMADQIDEMHERLAARPPRGDTPSDRVVDVLSRATRSFTRQRETMSAMLRALVSSDDTLASIVGEVRAAMSRIITEAMQQPADVDAIRILEYAWMGSLVNWLNGLNSGPQVIEDLETAVRMLLDGR